MLTASRDGEAFAPWLDFSEQHALFAAEPKVHRILLLRVMFVAISRRVDIPAWLRSHIVRYLQVQLAEHRWLVAELIEVHCLAVEDVLGRGAVQAWRGAGDGRSTTSLPQICTQRPLTLHALSTTMLQI